MDMSALRFITSFVTRFQLDTGDPLASIRYVAPSPAKPERPLPAQAEIGASDLFGLLHLNLG